MCASLSSFLASPIAVPVTLPSTDLYSPDLRDPASSPDGRHSVDIGACGRVVLLALYALEQVVDQFSVQVNTAAEYQVAQGDDGPVVDTRDSPHQFSS